MELYCEFDESNGKILGVSTFERQNSIPITFEEYDYLNDKNGYGIYDYKIIDGFAVKIEEEEKKQLYPFLYPNELETEKVIQETYLQAMMTANVRNSFLVELPDEKASMIPLCYDAWETNKAYKVGDRVEWDGKLWKCHQAHTSQENWKPSIDTASLWEVINVENAGTLDDPIPYDQTMTVYNGKYYLEEGIIYKCIRDSGQPLYATCASLVGNYFEVAS